MIKKIIIRCPKCKKKMKIPNTPAKYRCPSCKEIYKYTTLKKIINFPIKVIAGFFQTISDIIVGVKNKYTMTKNTIKYTSQLKKNMKSNPNWSNVQKEKNRMKEAEKTNKKPFFHKFRK